MTADIARTYRKARATIGCAHFKAGEIVDIRFYEDTRYRFHKWFAINRVGDRRLPYEVAYPDHHLTDFSTNL